MRRFVNNATTAALALLSLHCLTADDWNQWRGPDRQVRRIIPHLALGALGLVFVAMGHGANATIPNVFWAEFYGTKHIGAIKSVATAIMVFGSAIGPWITGALIDNGIAFEQQMIGLSAYFAAVIVIVFFGVRHASSRLPVSADA